MPHKNHKPQIHNISNYEEFVSFVDNLPEGGPKVFFLFSGTKRENGRSWCISCQLAEPVVNQYLHDLKMNIIFGFVDVGEPAYWRDKDCPFRTDKRLGLMVIPTMIKWKGVKRLEGSQCNKRDLLHMLFEEEDE
ncbi:hypothetical protein NE865_06063 [Phthorimaea operculella]|nr:hypothetical protein NE865_06063 [Phthorimaea operculella]